MIGYTQLVIYPTQIREFDHIESPDAGKVHKRERISLSPILIDVPDTVLLMEPWRVLGEYIEREARKRLPERSSANSRYQDGVHHLEVYLASSWNRPFNKYLCSITMYSTEGNFAVTRDWRSEEVA